MVGTSITPPSAVPRPINHAPPPLSEIRSARKFQAALKPIQTSNAAARYPQNRGAWRNSAVLRRARRTAVGTELAQVHRHNQGRAQFRQHTLLGLVVAELGHDRA